MIPEPLLKAPLCTEYNLLMHWGETDFTYTEGGIDELIATIRKLVDVAKQAKQAQAGLWEHEYLVRVAA